MDPNFLWPPVSCRRRKGGGPAVVETGAAAAARPRRWKRKVSLLCPDSEARIYQISSFYLNCWEDKRHLFDLEINLRLLVKRQMATLLCYINLYWKRRYTVNRIILWDECTKFFHALLISTPADRFESPCVDEIWSAVYRGVCPW